MPMQPDPLDSYRQQLIAEYLKKLQMQRDPNYLQREHDYRQDMVKGREDLATLGRTAAGLNEATSIIGGSPAGTQIPAMAKSFEARAAAMPKQTGSPLGLDPKILKLLERKKADRPKWGPGALDSKTGITTKYLRGPGGEIAEGTEGVVVADESFDRKQKKFTNQRAIRKDYKLESKGTIEMRRAYDGIMDLTGPSFPADGVVDQSMLVLFNKMLDPISVVRESEFARAAGAGSALDLLEGKIKKMAVGTLITDDLRQQFRNAVIRLWKIAREHQLETDAYYTKMAEDSDLPTDFLIPWSQPQEIKTSTKSKRVEDLKRDELIQELEDMDKGVLEKYYLED